MEIKEQIRPYYGQLISLLDQLPNTNEHYNHNVHVDEIKAQVSEAIAQLLDITGEDYSAFNIKSERAHSGGELAALIAIKAQISGLLGRLGAKYFSDEQKASAPGTQLILNQHQLSTQNLSISILNEVSGLLSQKESKYPKGSDEGKFMDKLKGSVGTIQNIAQLLTTIAALAQKYGITPDKLKEIFS